MTNDTRRALDDLLPEGVLPADSEAELRALEEALHRVADSAEMVPPPRALRERLLASAAGAEQRFAPFTQRLAELFDVGLERAGDYLSKLLDPAAWEEAIGEGIALVHLEGGLATAGADVGFVRVAAGQPFPEHRHDGGERVLVLRGGYRDSSGVTVRTGERTNSPPGSTHSFVALPGEDLLFAVVGWDVQFED